MNKIKDLKIWVRAMDITVDVYRMTECFPNEEKYGLTSQVRRAAVSIPSNIVEGAGRNTHPEFNNFLGYANGSMNELETQIILSQRLDLIQIENSEILISKIEEIKRMSYALQRSLNLKRRNA